MNIIQGRISGENLRSSEFYRGIKNCKILYMIDGNFSFTKFKTLQNYGVKLDDFEEIKIIISTGRNSNLVNLFENFFTYSLEEKKDILEEAFLGSVKNIGDELVQEIYNKILQDKIQIKLGFTKDNNSFSNDEIIFGNKHALLGAFNKDDFFISHEYYYALNKKDIQVSKLNFEYKFNKSFPFNIREESLVSKEFINSTNNCDLKNIFNFKDFINEIFEDRLGIKRNIEKDTFKNLKNIENYNDKDNPFILDEINEEEKNSIKLRAYQQEAINELVVNNFNGKIQMATGTGKTFTTLYGLKKYLKGDNYPTNITLVVPLKQLVSQWETEIKKVFGTSDIFIKDEFKIYKCYSEEKEWRQELEHYVGINNEYKYNFIIFVDDSFGKYIKEDTNIDILKSKDSMLIVDEAHNLTKQDLSILINSGIFKSTLALSATLYDEDDFKKNKMLDEFFKGINFSYTINEAIESGYLCEYEYFPVVVDLNSEEVERYKEIRSKIDQLKDNGQLSEEYLQLKKEETNLISKAHRKVEYFEKDLEKLKDKNSILVYSNRGNYAEVRYIDYISTLIRTKINVKVEQIIGKISQKQRDEIIKNFQNNEVQVITAIKCLDEGIDIPSIKRAYLLYSGGKSKEYIQRRGRILRKHENKKIAYIHDYIVKVDGEFPEREIKRFNEYVSVAKNKEELKTFLGDNNGK